MLIQLPQIQYQNKQILIMNYFTFITKAFVSRAKTLLKRRRRAVKGRPISKKKLQQQSKLFNYAKQYRALQIQKQLDRKSYASQHINELIDQIFYPDVTQAHEEAARYHIEASQLKYYLGEQKYQDIHEKEIDEKVLATQLIQYYLKNQEQLNINHFLKLSNKFMSYFHRREKIKQSVERKWKKMNEKMKQLSTKQNKYQQKKCPYLFIDRDDTFHYQPWNKMINSIVLKLEFITKESPEFMPNFFTFQNIIQTIDKSIYYVPEKMFKLFERQLQKISADQLQNMEIEELQSIVSTIQLQKKVRLSSYHTIKGPESLLQEEQMRQRKEKIVYFLLSHPQLSSEHLQKIISIVRNQIIPVSQQIQSLLKVGALKNMAELRCEKVIDLLEIFLKIASSFEAQFVQIMKYDIFRKCIRVKKLKSLFRCLSCIRNQSLIYRFTKYSRSFSDMSDLKYKVQPVPENNQIYAYDLLLQCSKVVLSKSAEKALQYKELTQLVETFYINFMSEVTLLELASTQIVKIKDYLKLGQLTHLIFKLYLLGYHSPVLGKILFEEYKKKYNETKNRAKSEQIPLLEGNSKSQAQGKNSNQTVQISFEQIKLEEDLIISLWILFMTNLKQGENFALPIDQLLQIYPLKIHSKFPLVCQLVLGLNELTSKFGVLWQIRYSNYQQKISIMNHRLNHYYVVLQNNEVVKLMEEQGFESGLFIKNYNIEQNKYIPQIWSKQRCYKVQQYLEYIKSKTSGGNFFNNSEISKKVEEKRIALIEKLKKRKDKDSDGKSEVRLKAKSKDEKQIYYELI